MRNLPLRTYSIGTMVVMFVVIITTSELGQEKITIRS